MVNTYSLGISSSTSSTFLTEFGLVVLLAHLIPLQFSCDYVFVVVVVFLPLLAGVDVVNGSFSGTATENCEGRTVTELQLHLV